MKNVILVIIMNLVLFARANASEICSADCTFYNGLNSQVVKIIEATNYDDLIKNCKEIVSLQLGVEQSQIIEFHSDNYPINSLKKLQDSGIVVIAIKGQRGFIKWDNNTTYPIYRTLTSDDVCTKP